MKKKRVLFHVSIICLILGLLVIFNFSNVVYAFGKSYYTAIEPKRMVQSVDGLLSILPLIEAEYTYEGTKYIVQFFYPQLIFFGSSVENLKYIYVNTSSPANFIVLFDFFKSYINIGLLIALVCDFIIIVRGVLWRRKNVSESEVDTRK